jgi:hypothetical protein
MISLFDTMGYSFLSKHPETDSDEGICLLALELQANPTPFERHLHPAGSEVPRQYSNPVTTGRYQGTPKVCESSETRADVTVGIAIAIVIAILIAIIAP